MSKDKMAEGPSRKLCVYTFQPLMSFCAYSFLNPKFFKNEIVTH